MLTHPPNGRGRIYISTGHSLLLFGSVMNVAKILVSRKQASINAFLCPCCLTSASDGTQLLLLLRGQRYGGICICANVFLFFARGEPDYIRHNGRKTCADWQRFKEFLSHSVRTIITMFLRNSRGALIPSNIHRTFSVRLIRFTAKYKEKRNARLTTRALKQRKTDKKLKQDRIRVHQ